MVVLRGQGDFDAHGFKTDLIYQNGNLTQVKQEGGRWLKINWGTIGTLRVPVISSVESGSDDGHQLPQHVTYWYSKFGPAGSTGMYVLTKVIYEDEPAPGQTTSAFYTYSLNYQDTANSAWPNSFPLLKTADDPHFAGAMTKISYKYFGEGCPATSHPPGNVPPLEYYDWFFFTRETILEERAVLPGPQYVTVSRFEPQCQTGQRKDHNGIGGWRKFFYGRSSGIPDLYSQGYELTMASDFTRESDYGMSGAHFSKQRGNEPGHVWDARGLLTQYQWNDGSGRPSYVGFIDNSNCVYDRTNPPAGSATPDPGRMHNSHHHWLYSKKDELNKVTTYRRDSRMRITDIIYHDGTSDHFEYNIYNQVELHRLPSLATITYHYDQFHRLEWEHNDVDGDESDKHYFYDSHDRVTSVVGGLAAHYSTYTVQLAYNGRHQVISETYPATDYDSQGTILYEYDTYGNCKAITDELGHQRQYTYDAYRRCTSYTEPINDSCGNSSRTWNWYYDRVVVDDGYNMIGHYDPLAHTSKEWRVQIGPVFNTNQHRRVIARTFDVNNRMRSEQTGLVQSPGETSWHEVPDEVEVHTITYDENGQKKTTTDPKGRITHYDYDNRNRLHQTTEDPAPGASPSSSPRVTITDHDVGGNKTRVTFPDGETQQWSDYDAFGQAWTFTDERQNITNLAYQWGPMKKLLTVTTHREKDGGGADENQQTTFHYDKLGRLDKTTFPDTDHTEEITTYKYGQLWQYKTRKNQWKTLTYDARGREKLNSWTGNFVPSGVTRRWDRGNRLTYLSNSFATIEYTYDHANQMTKERTNVAGSGSARDLIYCRYPSGEVSLLTYPDGSTVVSRDYTSRGQLKGVGWGVAGVGWEGATSYGYNPDGKVNFQVYTNSVSTDYGYDGRGMISSILFKRGGVEIGKREYWRDKRDRITAWKRGTAGPSEPSERHGRRERGPLSVR